ncbi:MAG: hypothetical protein ACRCUM_02735 [Mycoplasmoidaceae bacterium]
MKKEKQLRQYKKGDIAHWLKEMVLAEHNYSSVKEYRHSLISLHIDNLKDAISYVKNFKTCEEWTMLSDIEKEWIEKLLKKTKGIIKKLELARDNDLIDQKLMEKKREKYEAK